MFISSLSIQFEYLITLDYGSIDNSRQRTRQQTICRSCLRHLFTSRWNLERTKTWRQPRDTWNVFEKKQRITTEEEKFIIELNAQPSFIIFSYLFTPKQPWLGLERNRKDFIIQFYFTIHFRFPSLEVVSGLTLNSCWIFSHRASGFSSNLKPFCSVYVCSVLVVFFLLLTKCETC